MTEITSADNPRYKLIARLLDSGRERRKSALTVLDGIHLVEAYREHVGEPQELVVSRAALADAEVNAAVARHAGRTLVLTDTLFEQLSTVTTPTGIMARVSLPPVMPPPSDMGSCLVLDGIQDPGNLGSILRSAAASGLFDVLLTTGCAQAWSPRVLRAGMGAHFALRLYEHADVAAFATAYRGRLVATARDAEASVFDSDLRGDIALMFGNEGAGLSAEVGALAREAIRIPMPGAGESLNVAAAAAVCLFERLRQLGVH